MRHLFVFSLVVCLAAGLAAQANKAPTNNAPTAATVGDADSFGRAVTYLGVATSGTVFLQTDCTPDPSNPLGPHDRCVTINASPAPTIWDFEDLGNSIQLPAKATHSLVCFAFTPQAVFDFNNDTGGPAFGRFIGRAVIRIENPVLNDPSLIDPATGLPFNGSFKATLNAYSETRILQPSEIAFQNMILSRDCQGGLVSRNSLIQGEGLSAKQADAFFANPTTFHFGSTGRTNLVDSGSYGYGIRLYGD